MELRQLRQFVTLAETLNFHRAAEALHMTQPPLSLSIRRLEAELGGPLFERHARGVTLTEAGEAVLASAREALRSADEVVVAFRETRAGQRGLLRVGFVGSATWGLAPAIIPAFRHAHPGIDLSLKEATSQEVVQALESGALDIGLVRTPLMQSAAVELAPLYREALMLMTPKEHRLTGESAARLEDLSEERFILFDRNLAPSIFHLTMMECEAVGFQPRIAEEAAHVHTIISLVECGLGVALAPSVMRRAAAERVACLALTAGGRPIQVGFALAFRQDEARPVVRAFANCAEQACAAIQSTY